jgi:hypothetical protein
MIRSLRIAGTALGFILLVPWVLSADLWAFNIVEVSHFKEGPYTFKMEVQKLVQRGARPPKEGKS